MVHSPRERHTLSAPVAGPPLPPAVCRACLRTAACTADRVRDIDQGAAFTAGANAMLGVGLTALVAGVVMIGVGGARPVTPAVEAFADPSRGVLGVRGAF